MKEKYLKKLLEVKELDDIEVAHIKADDILCDLLIELGYQDIVDIYDEIYKWYA